jgi:hypothetical protein
LEWRIEMDAFEHDVFSIENGNHNDVPLRMNDNYGPQGWEAYAVVEGLHGIIVHMRRRIRKED